MKIAFIADTNSHVKKFIDSLSERGHALSLITFSECNWENVEIFNLGESNRWSIISSALKIKSILKQLKPDVVHAHYVFPFGIYAYLSNFRPLILSIWGSDLYPDAWRLGKTIPRMLYKTGLVRVLFRAVHKALSRRVELVTINGSSGVDRLTEFGYARIEILLFGPDTGLFSPERRDKSFREKAKGCIILSIRQLKPIYDVSTLIRAFRIIVEEFPDASVIIGSDGSENERLKRLADRLGLSEKVKFLGFVKDEKLPAIIASADIMVSTAISDLLPTSILEGMACSLPVIATDVGSLRDWIKSGENGFLFKPGDERELANKLRILLSDEKLRERMGVRNREVIKERADWRFSVDKIERLYMEIVRV